MFGRMDRYNKPKRWHSPVDGIWGIELLKSDRHFYRSTYLPDLNCYSDIAFGQQICKSASDNQRSEKVLGVLAALHKVLT